MRSSMLAAIERGRVPAVDFLNGEVVERGERLGIPTPANREAQRMVHEIAHGRLKVGIAALHTLRDRVERDRVERDRVERDRIQRDRIQRDPVEKA